MLINEKEALARIASPLNLLNKIRSRSSVSMSLFVPPQLDRTQPPQLDTTIGKPAVPTFNPFQKPDSDSNKSATTPTTRTAEVVDGDINLDKILDGADNKIKLSHAHNAALDTLVSAVGMMHTKLDDIKPDKLPQVITAAAKVVDGIRRERNEAAKAASGKSVHLHFYTPTPKKIEEYEIIDVG